MSQSSQHEEPQRNPLRESRFEPYEVNRPIPVFVLAVAFALVAWGAWTLWSNSGDNVADTAAVSVTGDQVAVDPDEALLSAGAALLEANCATCHQMNGSGVSNAIPPLVDSRYVTGPADAPVQILLHGIDGPMAVRGNPYNGRMATFGDTLGDHEIAAVVSYIRGAWGNAAEPVDASFVAEQRARFDSDRGPWSGGAELETVTGIPARLTSTTAMEASPRTCEPTSFSRSLLRLG